MAVIKRGIVKSYDAASHKAAVQIAGSLAVWLDGVRVATNIPAADIVTGRRCSVLFLDPSNQDEAVVLTIHDALPSAGGGHDPAMPTLNKTGTQWTIPGWQVHNAIGLIITMGNLYYVPIYVAKTHTYIEIGLVVQGAGVGFGSSQLRLGLYNAANGGPSSLRLDAGVVSVATTGQKSIVISHSLPVGLYFLAWVTDDLGVALYTPDNANPITVPVSGFFTSARPRPRYVTLYATGRTGDVLGGLVDPAPTPAPTGHDTTSKAAVMLREQ